MIENIILSRTIEAVYKLYNASITEDKIQIQNTNKEFEGDFTIVTFPLLKISRKSPDKTAEEIGNYLLAEIPQISKYYVIKGFLNILLKEEYWLSFLNEYQDSEDFGFNKEIQDKPTVIEYSSPNTNKPLQGHRSENHPGNY